MYISNFFKNTKFGSKKNMSLLVCMYVCRYVCMYIAILRIEPRNLSVLGKCSTTELHLHTKSFGFDLVKNMFS